MKQEALAIIAGESDPGRKLNLLREYLQAFALRSLQESGAFESEPCLEKRSDRDLFRPDLFLQVIKGT